MQFGELSHQLFHQKEDLLLPAYLNSFFRFDRCSKKLHVSQIFGNRFMQNLPEIIFTEKIKIQRQTSNILCKSRMFIYRRKSGSFAFLAFKSFDFLPVSLCCSSFLSCSLLTTAKSVKCSVNYMFVCSIADALKC